MKKKKTSLPILEEGFVKNFSEKVRNVGKPSIFIGSSGEAIPLAEKIQSRFEKDLFQVDIWSDGIFGKTKSSGGEISNMEWLKNFSDIYDFAIFLFTLEDDLKGIRKDQPKGKNRRARVVRHNVVFEFGMFLGRIGVKRSFILVDSKAEKFVDLFFTDLKENKKDKVLNVNADDDFQIEFYDYGSIPKKDYGMKDTGAFYEKHKGMGTRIDEIKNQISKVFKQVDIGFLPATSLAIGYFNNSVNIFLDIFSKLKANEILAKREEKTPGRRIYTQEETEEIIKIKTGKGIAVHFKIVVPISIQGAIQKKFMRFLDDKTKFSIITFPGLNRPLTFTCGNSGLENENEELVIYDIPTTLSSSIEAIEMVTNSSGSTKRSRSDVSELLSGKERINFLKSARKKIEKADPTWNANKIVQVVSWEDFLKETGQTEIV